LLVNYYREYQIDSGVPKALAYDNTMYVLAGLLALGFVCNLLIRPVAGRHFMSAEQLAYERRLAHERTGDTQKSGWGSGSKALGSTPLTSVLAWAAVGVPLAWGVWVTLQKAVVLFR
jgi:hypothetical protein